MIFFTVFFSVFYLFGVVLSYPVYVKAQRMARMQAVTEQQQMEDMASRPMASAYTLLTEHVVSGEQARLVADLQALKQLPATPISFQPVASSRNVAVASYIVELPSEPSFRQMMLGTALVELPDAVIPPRPEPPESAGRASMSRVDTEQTRL